MAFHFCAGATGLDAAEIKSPYWQAGEGLDHPDDVVLKSLVGHSLHITLFYFVDALQLV